MKKWWNAFMKRHESNILTLTVIFQIVIMILMINLALK